MLRALACALFPDDGKWVWRRRIAVSSAAVFQAGILNSVFWDRDIAHATMIMDRCMEGIGFVFTVYIAGTVSDAHFRRKVEAGRPLPPGGTPQ